MSGAVKRLQAKCTEIAYRILKRIIQSKIGCYPYRFYLKRSGRLPYEISIFLASTELRINRIISNSRLDSKKD